MLPSTRGDYVIDETNVKSLLCQRSATNHAKRTIGYDKGKLYLSMYMHGMIRVVSVYGHIYIISCNSSTDKATEKSTKAGLYVIVHF